MSLPVRKDEPVFIEQPHGGKLRRGGKRGNKGGGPLPNEIRRLLRAKAFEHLPGYWAKFSALTEDQQAKALDLALKYGVGTQVQVMSEDALKAEKAALVEAFVGAVNACADPETAQRIVQEFNARYTPPSA